MDAFDTIMQTARKRPGGPGGGPGGGGSFGDEVKRAVRNRVAENAVGAQAAAARVVLGEGLRAGPLDFMGTSSVRSRYKRRKGAIVHPEFVFQVGNERRTWQPNYATNAGGIQAPMWGAVPFKPWHGNATFFELAPQCLPVAYDPAMTAGNEYVFRNDRYIARRMIPGTESAGAMARLDHVFCDAALTDATAGNLAANRVPEGAWGDPYVDQQYIMMENMLELIRTKTAAFRCDKIECEIRVHFPEPQQRATPANHAAGVSAYYAGATNTVSDAFADRDPIGPVRCRLIILQFKDDTYEVDYNAFKLSDFFVFNEDEAYEPIDRERRPTAMKVTDPEDLDYPAQNAPYTIIVDETFVLEKTDPGKEDAFRFKFKVQPGVMNYHNPEYLQETGGLTNLNFTAPDRSAGRMVWGLFYEHKCQRATHDQTALNGAATVGVHAGDDVPYNGYYIVAASAQDAAARGQDLGPTYAWDLSRAPQWNGKWHVSISPMDE